MSFRFTLKTKRLLAAAAEDERRCLINMLEVLLEEFCARNQINETLLIPSITGTSKEGRTKK